MKSMLSHLILPIQAGTPATALLHKGLQPAKCGPCTGTQVEQGAAKIGVPSDKVEPEPIRNGANHCCTTVCGLCSAVPLAPPISAASLQHQISVGGQA
jgi:hypothetical protein